MVPDTVDMYIEEEENIDPFDKNAIEPETFAEEWDLDEPPLHFVYATTSHINWNHFTKIKASK